MSKTIKSSEEKLLPVIRSAETVEIVDSESLKQGVEVLSNLNKVLDGLEADRLKLTAPLNATLKEINGRYKERKEKLSEAISSIRLKMSAYQTKVLALQSKAEDAIAKRIGPGKGKLGFETAVRQLGEVEKAEKKIEGENGSIGFVEIQKFEVVDILKLPVEYHLANEPKIRLAMKDGKELPGVRYWKEQSVRNNR